MVDREITLTYADLLHAAALEIWMTLNCVSNTVGGPLISNAWWSGTHLKDLLEEAGVQHGRRRGEADLRRRLDLRHAAVGDARRPRGDAGLRDERRAAADRARVPGAHAGARPVRLRLGVQVGARHRGDDVRLLHGVLDRARLVGAGARSSWPPGSTYPATATTCRPGRCGSVAWPGSRTPASPAVQVQLDGGGWQPATIAREEPHRLVGAVGRDRRAAAGPPPARRACGQRGRSGADGRACRPGARTAPRAGTPSVPGDG